MNRTKEGFDPTQKYYGHYPLCPEFDIRPSWCICDRLEQVMDTARADADAEIAALKARLKDTQRQARGFTEWRINLRDEVERKRRLVQQEIDIASKEPGSFVMVDIGRREALDDVLALIDRGDDA